MTLTADDIKEQRKRLATHRQTLSYSLESKAKFGAGAVPTVLSYTIDDARKHIRSIKFVLRQAGETVEDHLDDEEQTGRLTFPPHPESGDTPSTPPIRQRPRISGEAIGGAMTILALLVGLASLLRDLTNVTIPMPVPTITATTLVPVTAVPNVTPTFEVPWYDLHTTKVFTDADGLFQLSIPENWRLYHSMPHTDSATLAIASFAPQPAFDLYWRITVEVIDESRINLRMQELAPYVRSYVGATYSTFPGIQIDDPVLTADLNIVRVFWSFTPETPDDKTIQVRALTEVRRTDNLLSVFTIYVPADQFDQQAVNMLRDSLVVHIPSAGR